MLSSVSGGKSYKFQYLHTNRSTRHQCYSIELNRKLFIGVSERRNYNSFKDFLKWHACESHYHIL